jgi:hypothetical protein
MTSRVETFWRFLVLLAVLAALVVTVLHAARADEPFIPGKFYVVAVISDNTTNRKYGRLRYNPAGAFDTYDDCIAWAKTANPEFKEKAAKLKENMVATFGPDTTVTFECWSPPEPGQKI